MLLAIAAAGLMLAGCGGSARATAYAAIDTSYQVVRAVDAANAEVWADTRQGWIDTATDRQEAERARAPFRRVNDAVHAATDALLSAEAFVDATGGADFAAVAPCIAAALARLREAVAGVEAQRAQRW